MEGRVHPISIIRYSIILYYRFSFFSYWFFFCFTPESIKYSQFRVVIFTNRWPFGWAKCVSDLITRQNERTILLKRVWASKRTSNKYYKIATLVKKDFFCCEININLLSDSVALKSLLKKVYSFSLRDFSANSLETIYRATFYLSEISIL